MECSDIEEDTSGIISGYFSNGAAIMFPVPSMIFPVPSIALPTVRGTTQPLKTMAKSIASNTRLYDFINHTIVTIPHSPSHIA